MANVGKNIRQLRVRARLTQDALAEKLHTTRQTVSNYETGKSRPDVEMLEQIAAALNTDANTLIYGIPPASDRRRQLRTFLIAAAVTAALGVAAVILRPIARELQTQKYLISLTCFLAEVLLPIFFCLLGRTVMQGCGPLGMKPFQGGWTRIAHIGILALLTLYILAWIPETVYGLWVDWQFLYGNASSVSASLELPRLWLRVLRIWDRSVCRVPFFFFLPGAMLWLTRRQEKSKAPTLRANPQ